MSPTTRTSLYVAVATASLVLATFQPTEGLEEGARGVTHWIDDVTKAVASWGQGPSSRP